ncbi:MAG: IS200/IS605 family transposase [Syntrophaceae bacterium]
MVNINSDIWHWYHNVSECYYHIQITVKYRKALINKKVEKVILESISGIKERHAIEVSHLGFDQNHVHLLTRFLPKYSGGQVIKLVKSLSAKAVFREVPEIKAELWGGEFWTDGYYIATISGKGNKTVIEKYIKNQGREKDIEQLKLFEF